MTRDRLTRLSETKLHRLAEEFDVDPDEHDSREALIDTLYEAYIETRVEHDASNNDTMRVEERKYDVTAGDLNIDDRDGPDYGDTELPERYNETRMVLLLRDPAWAYAYWDVRDGEMEEALNESGFEGLSLRLIEMDNSDMGDHAVVDAVDIPVQPDDRRWYINLPQQETSYYTELIAYYEENRTVLARSNPVSVPRGGLSDVQTEGNGHVSSPEELVVALSGVERLGVSSFGRTIPQRIIALIDKHAGD